MALHATVVPFSRRDQRTNAWDYRRSTTRPQLLGTVMELAPSLDVHGGPGRWNQLNL